MPNYRVLVSDPISEKGVDALRAAPGISVDVNTGLKPDELLKIIGGYHGLVVRSQTKVTPEVFAAAKNLKVIGRAGVGVDNIDRSAATDHGVVVMNTPSGNTISTAEHAFTLMLSLARNIPQAHASIISGKWDRKSFEGMELNGKRLAILGMGRIQKQPVVIDVDGTDAIGIRVMSVISLGFDHRLIDGATADQFMADVKRTLETWTTAP